MSKHDDKTKDQLLELVDDLEDDVERLELELLDAGSGSLSDYDDSDIRDEFHARGLGCDAEEVSAMFEAFYLGRDAKAIELAKRIAATHAGRWL
jgi:hypothetical protein